MKKLILATVLGLAVASAHPSIVKKPVQGVARTEFAKKAEGGRKDKDKKADKKGKKERKRKESKKFHPGA